MVSIIIPVYNAGKYIESNVKSILGQKYKDLQIIYVDDGSTDNTIEILRKYNDYRISILCQDNYGAGVARNKGLKLAKGEYVMFLDADDTYSNSMIYELVHIANKKKTDVIVFGNYICEGKHVIGKREPETECGKVVSGYDIRENLFQIDSGVPWNKFIRRQFVIDSGLKYQEIHNTNDIFFNKLLLATAERILFIKRKFVYYKVYNTNSLQGKISQFPGEFIKALNYIRDEMIHREIYNTFGESYERFATTFSMYSIERSDDYKSFEMVIQKVGELWKQLDRGNIMNSLPSEEEKKIAESICDGKYSEAIFGLYKYNKQKYMTRGRFDYNVGMINIRVKRRV